MTKNPFGFLKLPVTLIEVLGEIDMNPNIKERLRKEGRDIGGYLTVADQNGTPVFVTECGIYVSEKRADYLKFSQEKAIRLAQNKEHQMSSQSRDPDNFKFGGAVRGDNYIISFSGCPEQLDELISTLLLYRLGDITRSMALLLLHSSENSWAGVIKI
jgi:hypothetical protein